MSRPACANPANIKHVVKSDSLIGRYCYRECICGEIVSDLGPRACDPVHGPHEHDCDCEITPVICLDCDAEFTPAEFTPADSDNDICAACTARTNAASQDKR